MACFKKKEKGFLIPFLFYHIPRDEADTISDHRIDADENEDADYHEQHDVCPCLRLTPVESEDKVHSPHKWEINGSKA